jgi:hypothetical protein
MTTFPALDVALGLSFVFFLVSVLSTAITESISHLTKQRSKGLEGWLAEALGENAENFSDTSVIRALHMSSGGKPSYIPSTHFVAAALAAGKAVPRAATTAAAAWKAIGEQVAGLTGCPAGDALNEIYVRAGGDAGRFRHDAEAWFDDQMERLSGVYRRWSQRIVWVVGGALIIILNANALQIATTLWYDPAARSIVSAQASNTTGEISADTALQTVQHLPLPLGWSGAAGYNGLRDYIVALFGWFLTLAAVSLGAPFWFDTLSRFARIRNTGSPPPATDATRHGEGDQTRTLPDTRRPLPGGTT